MDIVDAKPALTATTVAARDALMQYPQQWEHIASDGHVLEARVDAYRHKAKVAFYVLSAAILIALLSQWLPQRVGAIVGVPVGKVAGWFDSKPAMPTMSPAPALAQIQPKFPYSMTDTSGIPSSDVIGGALQAAARNIKSGAAIKGCDTSTKLTDDWATQDSAVPHCRYSADKSRTWVWGLMTMPRGYAPFFALVRKTAQGVDIYNVTASRTQAVGQYPQLDLQVVPRAAGADFPELAVGAQQ